jgi:hypothetical protein
MMDASLVTGFTRLAGLTGLTGFFRPVNPVNLVNPENPVVKSCLLVPCVNPVDAAMNQQE